MRPLGGTNKKLAMFTAGQKTEPVARVVGSAWSLATHCREGEEGPQCGAGRGHQDLWRRGFAPLKRLPLPQPAPCAWTSLARTWGGGKPSNRPM